MRTIIVIAVIVAVAVPVLAQEALFFGDFEWGDTGDWSTSEPIRCDRIEVFGRGLRPSSEIHVATWGRATEQFDQNPQLVHNHSLVVSVAKSLAS